MSCSTRSANRPWVFVDTAGSILESNSKTKSPPQGWAFCFVGWETRTFSRREPVDPAMQWLGMWIGCENIAGTMTSFASPTACDALAARRTMPSLKQGGAQREPQQSGCRAGRHRLRFERVLARSSPEQRRKRACDGSHSGDCARHRRSTSERRDQADRGAPAEAAADQENPARRIPRARRRRTGQMYS